MSSLDGIERQTGEQPVGSVVWLHGLGADASDFVPIVPELLRPGWPALRFVFPNAPVRPITLNGGMRMRGWYDLLGLDRRAREDETGIRESVAALDALIEREIARGVPAERIFVAGFSQGGAVAGACMIRQPRALAGAILLSTYLPLATLSAAEATTASRATPVFAAHGSADPVIAEALGADSADVLRQLGHAVTWHSYPMPHSVCAEEISDLGDWLQARFDRWT
jgi:phospholipase/carboxylesterase